MNLASILKTNADNHGSKTAIRCGTSSLSYSQVWDLTERIARYLHSAGIESGDRVGLCMAETVHHLVAHYAVARLSAVIVPMDHRWTVTEKSAAGDAFRTKIVLIDEGSAAIDGIATRVLAESKLPPSGDGLPSLDEEDTVLLLSLSSGTTGKPKGALISHRQLYERFVSQWHAIGYGSTDTFAVVTPFYFGAGRSFSMSLLAAGGTVLIAPPPMKPDQIVSVLSDKTVTATFLPPTLLRRLLLLPARNDGVMFENLNYLIASGEPLFADEAQDCIKRISTNLFSYYASSEGGGISILRPEDFSEFAASVGKPTYKTEVQIVDQDGIAQATGTVGRLRYRGPGVSTRYLDGDGKEHDSAVGGWFYPGDLAEELDSGHIALRGRDKDVIIRGGVNIYPAEIEAALLSHEDIVEAAVIGIGDTHRGEIVKAFLVAKSDVGVADLTDWCTEKLAPYKRPQEFLFLTELPKSNSGKTDKKALELL